jgi:hypothetical protein
MEGWVFKGQDEEEMMERAHSFCLLLDVREGARKGGCDEERRMRDGRHKLEFH